MNRAMALRAALRVAVKYPLLKDDEVRWANNELFREYKRAVHEMREKVRKLIEKEKS